MHRGRAEKGRYSTPSRWYTNHDLLSATEHAGAIYTRSSACWAAAAAVGMMVLLHSSSQCTWLTLGSGGETSYLSVSNYCGGTSKYIKLHMLCLSVKLLSVFITNKVVPTGSDW